MSMTYFSLHIFLLTPTLRFVNEILIAIHQHTPIITILIEHTLISSQSLHYIERKTNYIQKVFFPM